MGFWTEIVKSAFWKSLLFFFDDPTKGVIAFFLCLGGTTLIVRLFRSKQEFKQHVIVNVVISIAGGLCACVPMFVYYLLIGPGQYTEQIKVSLAKSESNERSATIAREGAETRVTVLDRQKNVPLVLHGACKLTGAQLNPVRAQPSCPAGTLPPTQRDKILTINARLTENERNRFSEALAEFEKSLTDGQDLFYKINEEGAKFSNDVRSGSVLNSYEKSWTDLTDEGWKYQKAFPQLRSKWQHQFGDQADYIFGDNPDNQGPNALINATSVLKGFLDAWKTIPRSSSIQRDYFYGLAGNEYQMRMKMFGDWNQVCFTRLTEMRNSIR
jgi:hypothetical protein